MSALSEGKIPDVILGLNEVVGELKLFCKILEGNYANIMRIERLPQPIIWQNDNTGRISRPWPA